MTIILVDMINFDLPIKIFVFKDDSEVKVCFKISDTCVLNKFISIEDFQYICNNWRNGVNGLETNMGKVWWEHRTSGPRPKCESADFVSINFGDWSFRITTLEMEQLVQEFNIQLIAKNHWD